MNKKAEKFIEYLQTNQITCFATEEMADEFHTVAFRSTMDVKGQALPTVVITDDTIYALVRVRVAPNVINAQNENRIRSYIDGLNKKFKVFKYYVQGNDEDKSQGDLVLDVCMPSTDDTFSAGLMHALIGALLNHLIEEYPTAMKYIWSEWSATPKQKSPRSRKTRKNKIDETEKVTMIEDSGDQQG